MNTIKPPFFLGQKDKLLTLLVHVKPGSKRDQVVALTPDYLDIKISGLPQEGQANAGVLQFLSDLLQIRKSQLSLVAGHKSREKRIQIAVDDNVLGAYTKFTDCINNALNPP